MKLMYNKKRIIYADHSATTRVRAEVVEAMLPLLTENFGNPSSIHAFGRKASEYLNKSRNEIASVINAEEDQIIFTSGGTESNNTVIFGLVRLLEDGKIKNKEKHIITSKIEHPSVKEPLEYLEKKGWKITWLDVDKEGFLDLNQLESFISDKTLLVSVIHANNEIGTIQSIGKISKVCRKHNVLFHTDSVQAFGKVPVNVKYMDMDFMSMSAHKIYGPKGVGALYIKSPEDFSSYLVGGGQENNLRSGTESLPSIVGFAKAAKLMHSEMDENVKKLRFLQIKLMEGLEELNDLVFTGVTLDKIKENYSEEKFLYRIPGHVSLCVKNVEGETLVLQADLRGIACSSGSACKSRDKKESNFEPSHVLVALTVPEEFRNGSLRLTLGRENTEADIEYIIKSVKDIVLMLNKQPSMSVK